MIRCLVALTLAGCATVPKGNLCKPMPVEGEISRRDDRTVLLRFSRIEVCALSRPEPQMGAMKETYRMDSAPLSDPGGAGVYAALAGVLALAQLNSTPASTDAGRNTSHRVSVDEGVFNSCGLTPRRNEKGIVLTLDEAKALGRGCLVLNGEEVLLSRSSMAWVE